MDIEPAAERGISSKGEPPTQPAPIPLSVTENDDLVQGLPAPENKRFYPAIDGLRAVAVLMVFFHHYVYGAFNARSDVSHVWVVVKSALIWGWAGVDFFFVLSGFLITGILYDTRDTAHRFRNFYVRRMLRIFPLYYGVLLFVVLLSPMFHWIWRPAWILWPLYLGNYARFLRVSDFSLSIETLENLHSSIASQPLLVLSFGHFWSLCVEEQFYLVWPLVVFLVRDRVRLRNTCVAVCILCLAARIACLFLVPKPYIDADLLYRFTPLRADALLLGGLIALMLRGPEEKWLLRIRLRAFYLFVSGGVVFEVANLLIKHHFYLPQGGAFSTIGYTLVDLFAGVVILMSLDRSSHLYRMFTLRPLRRLGQMSYGFYVFHNIPYFVYRHLIRSWFGFGRGSYILIMLVAFGGTLILSYLSFRYFESPFLRLKSRFTV